MSQATVRALSEIRPQVEADTTLLRIASYNVHGCVGTDGQRDIARVARVIRELGCDTIGLQEVGSHHDGRESVRQLEILARETGMHAVAGATIIMPDRDYGNALLTNRPVLEIRRHNLSYPRCEPRGALDVDLNVSGIVVRVIVTHLGLRPAERRHQVKQLIELLSEYHPERPLVIMGDINEWLPGGRPLKWLHELMDETPARRSYPTWLPLFALDRVWSRPRGSLIAFDVHRTPLSRCASDHFPVKATIALSNQRVPE